LNTLKTGLLMAVLFGLFMLVGRLLAGSNGLIIGFAFALATNFFAYWFSDKVALAMSGAQEVSEAQAPQLYRIVGRLATAAGLPMPRVYIIPSPQPNAFATGRDPSHAAVAVTQGILQALSQDELEGVLAHELAHVRNRDILISSIAAVFVGTLSFLAQFAFLFGGRGRDDDREGANPFVALIAALASYVAAVMIQLAISRAREYEADRVGAEICGRPLSLANALRRIEHTAERMPVAVNPATSHMYIINPLGGDALKSLAALFRTHPLTEDRVARLEAMARAMGQHGSHPQSA
jgi:heat shock protein HtpX